MISATGDLSSTASPSSCFNSQASTIGIAKANVFPEPVDALPMTSWPARMLGIAAAWISVGFRNLRCASEETIRGDKSRGTQADMSRSSAASSWTASPADANTLLSSSLSSFALWVSAFFFCFLSFFLFSFTSVFSSFLSFFASDLDGVFVVFVFGVVGVVGGSSEAAGSSSKPWNSSASSSGSTAATCGRMISQEPPGP